MNTDLAVNMVELADKHNLPDDHELRIKANEFAASFDGFVAKPQTCSVQKFMGAWARARRAWCDYTGDVLI